MNDLELTVRVINKIIEVNGLNFIIALILMFGLMAIITKITGDKSWVIRMMEGK